MRRDIDDALRGWPFEPGSGEIHAREVRTRDGRSVLQVRIELGLLQMESDGRPDGTRPHGFATYLDYLRHRAAERGLRPHSKAPPWSMPPEDRAEADREFVQFYHRRVAWLGLHKFENALRDAEHTLALMDFVARHGGEEEYVQSHERLRGLVLFHRAQALAALALERRRPEEAIEAIQEGLDRLQKHLTAWHQNELQEDDELPDAALIEQLRQLEAEVRRHFAVNKTLREQLNEAVATEDYERAARLRDQIRARGHR